MDLTIEQIRAARAALKWTANDLASRAGVAPRTIQTLETGQGLPDVRKSTLLAVAHALTEAGIEFIGTPDDRPGIRIGKPKT
jgi:transcriptional regulator with XRE-family HTH domain